MGSAWAVFSDCYKEFRLAAVLVLRRRSQHARRAHCDAALAADVPHLSRLPALPWQAGIAALLVLAAVFGLYRWLGHPELASPAAAPIAAEMPGAPPASRRTPG